MRRMYDNQRTSHIGGYTQASRARRIRFGVVQKRMLTLIVLVVMTTLVLLGGSIRAFASSQSKAAPLHKYYTSIRVEKGDSLWSIADDYIIDGVQSREDFIDEVCTLNHISQQDMLHSGDHLVVMYYSNEMK